MFVRALVILLLVLNLGVAAWWALHSPAPAPATEEPPLGVARLQLLREAGRPPVAAVPEPSAAAVEPAPPPQPAPVSATTLQCFSFGPFSDTAATNGARARLKPLVVRSAVREQRLAASGKGWRVYLPPQASSADAQAMAQRITAAGFTSSLIT